MKLATLVYVRAGGQTLMLHRIKKAQDIHEGKWNGLGGKLEQGETPEACAIREVYEESGLTIRNPEWRGLLTFPLFARDEDWYAFVYVAREFSGALIDSPEGRLAWIPDGTIASLPLWPGDRIFLPWLDLPVTFSGCFRYVEGVLADWSATFYAEGGVVVGEQAGQGAAPPARPFWLGEPAAEAEYALPPDPAPEPALAPPAEPVYRYSAREDGYCWLCGAPTEKRQCKIICRTCGFTRDCSDP